MQNMKLSHERYYGIGESRPPIKSRLVVHPMPDLSLYDTAIDLLIEKEKQILKDFNKILDSSNHIKSINIKGLGKGLWMRMAITANPNNFKCLSSYLRFCGFTKDSKASLRYSRYAKSLYYLMATETIRWDDNYKELYAKLKIDVAKKHPDYTKAHLSYATLNRLATFLAKRIFEYGKNNKILPLNNDSQ